MKNRTLRISLIVAILTLVTSCFMGSTFAKYVTNDKAEDSARVAKWGVSIDMSGFDAFEETYDGGKVESSVNVVAPGTKESTGAIKLSGTPEVVSEVTYVIDMQLSANWLGDDGNWYCPIIVNVGTTEICGLNYDNGDDFCAAVEACASTYTKTYAAGTDLSTEAQLLTIGWTWEISGATGSVRNQTDLDDTALGDAAADGQNIVIYFAVSVTVTQVD